MLKKIYCVIAICSSTSGIQSSPAKAVTGTVPCRVIDVATQLPISDASVCNTSKNQCGFTDSTGEYVFKTLSPDIQTFYASANGYDTLYIHNISTKSGTNKLVRFELNKSTPIHELDKIVVNSSRTAHKSVDQINGVTRMNSFDLTTTAGTANDVNRVLQTLPSVISLGADYDNTLYVRGGASQENITVIDGIIFENPNHFSSTISSSGAIGYVNSEVIDGLDFYAGAMPATIPPALSSATLITLRDGSLYSSKYQFDLNMSGLSFLTEGPLPTIKGSYLFNIRYSDIHFLKRYIDLTGTSQYGDSHIKLTIPLGKINTLKLTNVGGFDLYSNSYLEEITQVSDRQKIVQNGTGLSLETRTARFQNRAQANFSFRLESSSKSVPAETFPVTVYQFSRDTIFSPPFVLINNNEPGSDTVLAVRERLNYINGYSTSEAYFNRDNRYNLNFRNDFTLYTHDNNQFNAGVAALRSQLRLTHREGSFSEIHQQLFGDSAALNLIDSYDRRDTTYAVDSTVYNDQVSAYLQSVFSRGPLKLLCGLRGDYWSLLDNYTLSPRLGISLKTAPGTFSLSGGLVYNQPSQINQHLSDFMTPNPNYQTQSISFDVIEPQRAWHLVGGYEQNFWSSHVLTFESYYKYYDREYTLIQPDYYQYTSLYVKAIENGHRFDMPEPKGKKKAYGLEMTIQKKEHTGLYYSIAGSLFSVKNRYANGEWYDDINNVRSTINGSLGTTISKSHILSLRASGTGGRPYCKAIADSTGIMSYDTTQGYFTERLKPRMSLSLRYSFKHARNWGNLTGYIELVNLINTRPIVMRKYGWSNYLDTKSTGIIPVAGFTVDF